MKRVNNCYVYKVVFINTDYDNLEVINRSFGYGEFNTEFHLDKETYQYSKELIAQGDDTIFDFDKEFSQEYIAAFDLLMLEEIDLIIFNVD